MQRRFLLAAAGGLAVLPYVARAQARFPSRAVRLLVPFAPGQGSDVLARAMSDKLAATWEQPVVVENRAGANGALAASEVAKAADGHTLLFTSNSPMVINPNLYKKLPYNVETDFKPVALLATTELALVVSPSLPVNSVSELVAYARANPGKLNFGSPGTGSTSHLMAEAFRNATRTAMVHVPYKGSAPAMADLMAGTIQMMIDGFASSLPHVRSGRVRALAVTGKSESPFLPGVPTFASQGLPGLAASGWYGIFAPAATDAAVVQKLHADFSSVIAQPEFAPRFRSLYLVPAGAMSAAQFAQMVHSDTALWESTTKALGLYRSE